MRKRTSYPKPFKAQSRIAPVRESLQKITASLNHAQDQIVAVGILC